MARQHGVSVSVEDKVMVIVLKQTYRVQGWEPASCTW